VDSLIPSKVALTFCRGQGLVNDCSANLSEALRKRGGLSLPNDRYNDSTSPGAKILTEFQVGTALESETA
jgi:hypothetical protein